MVDALVAVMGSDLLVDGTGVAVMLVRLVLDLGATLVIVRGIYARHHGWNEQAFTYVAFNVVTLCLCLLLQKVPLELGFALGLFAVFGILRYRTEPIRIRDLTYLFIVIGLAILNGLTHAQVSVAEVVLVNLVIVATTWALAASTRAEALETALVEHDDPSLLLPGREEELAADLRRRTGLDVVAVRCLRVDLVVDTARLEVSYRPRAAP